MVLPPALRAGAPEVGISKSAHSSSGYQVYLIFIITQHIRDELLMKSLKDYLGCGRLNPAGGEAAGLPKKGCL